MDAEDEQKNDYEKEIIRLEAMLIEQDHRPFSAIKNFVNSRTNFNKDDPRRKSALFAFIYVILFSPTAMAVGGGLVAAASIGLLAYQSFLMRQQLVSSQNQWDLQHRTELFSVLYERKKCKDQEKTTIDYVSQAGKVIVVDSYEEDLCIASNARHRSEALMAFYKMEMKRISTSCKAHHSEECRPNLRGMNLRHVELNSVDISNSNISKSDALRANFSFSKAQNIDLSHSEISKARFISSEIQNCVMTASRASGAIFYMAKMQNCNLSQSDLQNACMMNASLENVKFDNSNVSNANFDGADLTNADFTFALGLTKEQLSLACSNGGTKTAFNYEWQACPPLQPIRKKPFEPGVLALCAKTERSSTQSQQKPSKATRPG